MKNLQDEFKSSSSYTRRLQILTLSPYTISKTMEFFGASRYLTDKARRWKSLFGIIPEVPKYSKGIKISEETKYSIQAFYEDDDISRLCPGKSDCLSVRNSDGEKEYKQKRLILGNLKEIFNTYKDTNNPNIGFSSFASLRPKWCIIAGASGTHSVCVCVHHQNPKLKVSAIGNRDLTYHDLIEHSVCDMSSSKCMLHKCRNCPGEDGVATYLNTLDNLIEQEFVHFSQWTTTDRATMINCNEPIDEFIQNLAKQIFSLTTHHYITKSQSQYLKQLKQTLETDEAIVIGDFSENYTFIAQDASQSFQWTNVK